MREVDIKKWIAEYKKLCIEILGMSDTEANIHFARAPDFDYGYSPYFYIKEEIASGFVNIKHE